MARHKNRITNIQVDNVRLFRTHYASFELILTVSYPDDDTPILVDKFPCRVGISELCDLSNKIQQEIISVIAKRASGKA